MNVNYNLDFNKNNLDKLIEKLTIELSHGVNQTLENAIIQASREMAQAQDMLEIEEMKKYEFSCEIEMYPMVQYIEANTAEEAIEIMEREIEDTGFMQDLDKRDFHCEVANQVKMTADYKKYVDDNKTKLGGTE